MLGVSFLDALGTLDHTTTDTSLDLARYGLCSLMGVADAFSTLRCIDVSFNNLGSLSYLPASLEVLRAPHNNIQHIEGLGILTKLTTLDLTYNDLVCLNGLDNNTRLCDLSVAHNRITTLMVESLKCLNRLDVGYNHLSLEALRPLSINTHLSWLVIEGNTKLPRESYKFHVMNLLPNLQSLDKIDLVRPHRASATPQVKSLSSITREEQQQLIQRLTTPRKLLATSPPSIATRVLLTSAERNAARARLFAPKPTGGFSKEKLKRSPRKGEAVNKMGGASNASFCQDGNQIEVTIPNSDQNVTLTPAAVEHTSMKQHSNGTTGDKRDNSANHLSHNEPQLTNKGIGLNDTNPTTNIHSSDGETSTSQQATSMPLDATTSLIEALRNVQLALKYFIDFCDMDLLDYEQIQDFKYLLFNSDILQHNQGGTTDQPYAVLSSAIEVSRAALRFFVLLVEDDVLQGRHPASRTAHYKTFLLQSGLLGNT